MDENEKELIIKDLAAKVKKASSEDVNAIKETLNGLDTEALKALQGKTFAENETVENLKALVDEVKEELNQVKDNITTESDQKNPLVKEFKEKKEKIKGLLKGSKEEVELKALTNRASVANNTQSVFLPTVGQLGRVRRALYDLFPKFPVGMGTHNGTITYYDWDEATSVKAAAVVAEGAAFPESSAKFTEYTEKLRKIGDTLPVTEEFGEDEQLAAAELENFINLNVEDEVNTQIAVGPGTGENLNGLATRVPAYTATAQSFPDPNIKDLARKMRTSIVKTRGSKYQPNFIAANSEVIDRYILKKDANNNYMFDTQTGTIAGLEIVEDNNLADNTMVIGDSRYGRIYEMGGIVISEGMVNAQFTEDAKTIKARKRLLFLIREVDKTGFLKVTDIDAALTTLASVPI